MSDHLSDAEIRDRLWKAIDDNHTGMLGLPGSDQHHQPMTAFVEEDQNAIWFFTRTDTDLAQEITASPQAQASFIFQDRKVQACIDGRIAVDHDPARIDRFWNPHVAAWYPDGKDDPRLTLLRLDPTDAAVWITDVGPVKYMLEVAKANAGKSMPDVGERRDLNLQ